MSTKPKVLVVDDEQVNRILAKRILELQDYEVFTASSGREALELLEADHTMGIFAYPPKKVYSSTTRSSA